MDKFVYVLQVVICLIFIVVHVHSEHYIWGRKKKYTTPRVSYERGAEDIFPDVGEPLILTPYIKTGELKTARNKSVVNPQIGNWTTYTGYFTVNEICDSNMFFWFVPAKKNWQTAPVLVWLQGGPGSGSFYGLFEEIGPFNHYEDGLKERKYTWNTENNIIYIDQPVGSGYSFSTNKCYPENMTTVTTELYSAVTQFFQLFPELNKNTFFLTGESFAGHYIPALAVHIHRNNPVSKVKINLTGILIANPLIQLSCHDYASFLFQWGIVGWNFRNEIMERQKMLKAHAEANQYKEAWEDWDYILNDLIEDRTSLTDRESMTDHPPDKSDYMNWVTTAAVRQQLHVGDTDYNDQNWDVYMKLVNTIAQPMTSELKELLETNTSVGIFSGNLDMVCLTTSTECVLGRLEWWGSDEYVNSKRKPFTVDGKTVAGWVKTAGPLYLVVVKDSGHSVPYYQPYVSLVLINATTTAKPGVNPGTLLDTSLQRDVF